MRSVASWLQALAALSTSVEAKRPRRDLSYLESQKVGHGTRVLTHGQTDGRADTFYGVVLLSRRAEDFGRQHRLVRFDDGEEKVMPLSELRAAK